jgi:hypothetical protein
VAVWNTNFQPGVKKRRKIRQNDTLIWHLYTELLTCIDCTKALKRPSFTKKKRFSLGLIYFLYALISTTNAWQSLLNIPIYQSRRFLYSIYFCSLVIKGEPTVYRYIWTRELKFSHVINIKFLPFACRWCSAGGASTNSGGTRN